VVRGGGFPSYVEDTVEKKGGQKGGTPHHIPHKVDHLWFPIVSVHDSLPDSCVSQTYGVRHLGMGWGSNDGIDARGVWEDGIS